MKVPLLVINVVKNDIDMIRVYSKWSMPWKLVITAKDDPRYKFTYYKSDTEFLSFDDERYNVEIHEARTYEKPEVKRIQDILL